MGAGAKELRRSSRMKTKQDDNGYAGSETPAEKRKRVWAAGWSQLKADSVEREVGLEEAQLRRGPAWGFC